MASHQIVPKTQELLLFTLSLILSPLLVAAADQVSISTSCAAALIVVATVALLLVAAYIVYYIRRYGNGFLGVAIVDRRDPTAEKGLRPAAVEALPTVRFSEIKTRKSGDVELECAVCLIEFQDPEILRLLPECCHVFHSDCIGPWLASHVTCPICRADLGKLKPSTPSKSRILDRISRGLSEPSDHHQHLTVQINASSESEATNTGIPRGVDGSVGPHATGEQVVQAAEDNNARTLLPKELCPKSDYRESVSKSKSWNCFSTAPTVDNSIHIFIGPTN